MSVSYRERMREVAEATEPDAASLHRVRARVLPEPVRDLMAVLPEPPSRQVARVRARLRDRSVAPRGRPMAWLATGGLALAAASIAGTLAVRPEPAPLDLRLGTEPVAIAADVRLRPEGRGHLHSRASQVAVAWEQGTVGVEVTPDAGVELSVTTAEAVIRVVGTAFDVTRDKLGTTVTVAHGRVAVDCTLGPDASLGSGEAHTCWPSSGAGLLGRAHALHDAAAPPAEVLAAVTLGLDQPDATDELRAELLAASLAPLVAQGQHAAALARAEAYLDLGGARSSMRRDAALLALSIQDCDRAVPHLLQLTDRTSAEQEALDRCRAR